MRIYIWDALGSIIVLIFSVIITSLLFEKLYISARILNKTLDCINEYNDTIIILNRYLYAENEYWNLSFKFNLSSKNSSCFNYIIIFDAIENKQYIIKRD